MKINEKEQELKEAGFELNEDPQFPYMYRLVGNQEEIADGQEPCLLYDNICERFSIYTGFDSFVYTNHTSAQEAVNWANQISHFDSI